MKTRIKGIGIAILIVFVFIQFIRPERNMNAAKSSADISNLYHVPDSVLQLLQQACYDCHSNNTRYPWYSNIQPIGLWLDNHIKEGKEDVNFEEFKSYKGKRRISKLRATANTIKDGTMPLKSYVLMHSNARLSEIEKQTIIGWIESIIQELNTKHDSSTSLQNKRYKRQP